MGVDGFSIANTGLNINKTSSAMSSEAEALARMGNDVQIRDVDGVTKKQKQQEKTVTRDLTEWRICREIMTKTKRKSSPKPLKKKADTKNAQILPKIFQNTIFGSIKSR